MVGQNQAKEQSLGRHGRIARVIETVLRTPQGPMIMQRATGVDYLDAEGRPVAGLRPAAVEASAHAALLRDEPRTNLDAVTAHFDGDVLTSIRVAYRDREDASQHEVMVTYRS